MELAKYFQLFIALIAVSTFSAGQGASADETSPALREHISSDTSAEKTIKAAQDNSVAAFFQVPSNQSASHSLPSTTKKASVGRLVWHVMDNMGVPMIVGKDNDIDPSLRGSVLTPPTQVPTMANLRKIDRQLKHNEETANEPATAHVPISDTTLHKIPQSELEGVELPAPRDESGH